VNADARTVLRTAVVLFVATVLQIGMFTDLSLFSVHPDLLLAVAVGSAIAWGPDRGAVVGFAAGLLMDVFLSGRFGVSGVAYGLTGYVTGLLSDTIVRRSRVLDAGLMLLGSALGVLVYALVAATFGEGTLGDPDLWRIIVLEALWAAALGPLVVPVCRWAGSGGRGTRAMA
jgi:rod shape-determining protein MreD